MAEKLVLIHGWSDCSASFKALKQSLVGLFSEKDIYFVDYESREDHLTFDDVVDGLRDQLRVQKLIGSDDTARAGDELNVIVHSTGGLVVRDFISRYYSHRLDACPVKRVIMLAPANFGSPLAHLGKSTLGSFMAGRKELGNFFDTGKQILSGLELGSSYQWELAARDVLHKTQFFSSKSIQATVLVGLAKYDGIKQAVNRPGTDGTVVIAGTNLNSVKFCFDFSTGSYNWDHHQTISESAFGIIPGVNHSTIVEGACDKEHDVHKFIVRALSTKNEQDFDNLRNDLAAFSADSYKSSKPEESQYQQFMVRVVDDFDHAITDYRIEFFVSRRDDITKTKDTKFGLLDLGKLTDPLRKASDEISYTICDEFHEYSNDASYRRFLVDNKRVRDKLAEVKKTIGEDVLLTIKLHLPKVDDGIKYQSEKLENIVIYDLEHKYEGEPAIFFPNTTTLLEFRVNRLNNYVSVGQEPLDQAAREKRYKANR